MIGERGTDLGAWTDHQIEHTRRYTGLLVNLRQQRGGGWRQLGGLEHDGVAGDQSRGRLPAWDGPGKVPRCDQPDNAKRLANRVGEGVGRLGGQRLAPYAKTGARVIFE